MSKNNKEIIIYFSSLVIAMFLGFQFICIYKIINPPPTTEHTFEYLAVLSSLIFGYGMMNITLCFVIKLLKL